MEHFKKWMERRNEPDALITSKKSMLTASEVEAAKEGYAEALKWAIEVVKANYLKEKIGVENSTQYTNTGGLDSMDDIRRELEE